MAKQKFYNFNKNSDFIRCEALSNFDKKILKLHYEGFLQKEIAYKLNMKYRAMSSHFRRLQQIYEVWEKYQEKRNFIKKMLKTLEKDI